jgi:hypothetical protein
MLPDPGDQVLLQRRNMIPQTIQYVFFFIRIENTKIDLGEAQIWRQDNIGH